MAFKRSYLEELKLITKGSSDGTVKLDFLTGSVDLTSTLENCWSMVEFFSILDSRFVKSNWNYELRGVNRYTSTLRYQNSGFFVACNPDSIDNADMHDMKVFVCLGGTDINHFGSELVLKIINRLNSLNFSCSRCDLAFDMIEDTGIVNHFCSAFENYVSGQKNIVTNIRRENFKIAGAGKFEDKNYENWTIGSRASAVYCRFYDKRVERKLRTKTIAKLHDSQGLNDAEFEYLRKRSDFWYRFEIELKGSWAKWVFPHLVDGTTYGNLFGHSMTKIFRIIPDASEDTSNAARSESEPWFQDFIDSLQNTDFV